MPGEQEEEEEEEFDPSYDLSAIAVGKKWVTGTSTVTLGQLGDGPIFQFSKFFLFN